MQLVLCVHCCYLLLQSSERRHAELAQLMLLALQLCVHTPAACCCGTGHCWMLQLLLHCWCLRLVLPLAVGAFSMALW